MWRRYTSEILFQNRCWRLERITVISLYVRNTHILSLFTLHCAFEAFISYWSLSWKILSSTYTPFFLNAIQWYFGILFKDPFIPGLFKILNWSIASIIGGILMIVTLSNERSTKKPNIFLRTEREKFYGINSSVYMGILEERSEVFTRKCLHAHRAESLCR